MIHEYAIEPALLKQWASNTRDYQEFKREYGLGTARIVSSFPKKKKHRLRNFFMQEAPADNQSTAWRRFDAMVDILIGSLVIRDVSVQSNDWYENIKAENKRQAFHAILSTQSIDIPTSLTPNNMYDDESPWNVKDRDLFERTNDGFFSIVGDLLRLSTKHIVIVDPYGWNDEAIETLKEIIGHICESRVNNAALPDLSLFYKQKRSKRAFDSTPHANEIKQRILKNNVFKHFDTALSVYELEERSNKDTFHNRCIMSEHGGVITGFGVGLTGQSAHIDEATLMDSDMYKNKWEKFVDGKTYQVITQSN